MRIYLPATAADIADDTGLSARTAHAVTAALRAANPRDSEEDLEVAAFLAAADASLDRLTATDLPVRMVVSADVPTAVPAGRDHLTEVTAPDVPWDAVVSVHVDDWSDATTTDLVSAAVGGDEAAVDSASELDLLWYDVTERAELAALLAR